MDDHVSLDDKVFADTNDFKISLGYAPESGLWELAFFDRWKNEHTFSSHPNHRAAVRAARDLAEAYTKVPAFFAQFQGAALTNPVMLVPIGIHLPTLVGVYTDQPEVILPNSPRHTTVILNNMSVAVAGSPWEAARIIADAATIDPAAELARWATREVDAPTKTPRSMLTVISDPDTDEDAS